MITKIEFSSQSKSVVSKVSVEGDESPEELLTKAKELCAQAEAYALDKTFERATRG